MIGWSVVRNWRLVAPLLLAWCWLLHPSLTQTGLAQTDTAQTGTVVPLLKLLESGRVPPERQGTIVEMICTRGQAADLAVVAQRLARPDGFTPAVRLKAIELLTDAAVTRKVTPAGDLSGLTSLIASEDSELQIAAIRLAAAWKLTTIADALERLAAGDSTDAPLQQAAIEGLVGIGDPRAKAAIETLAAGGKTTHIRLAAAAGLARIDIDAAVRLGAAALARCTAQDDPAPLIEALLGRQDGADKLAAALADKMLAADVAKICLRHMYSIGRSDAALSDVLSQRAGIATDAPPPSQEEVAKIAAEVVARGNAARGERIFRRADLSCLKCHSIAQAGGNVGPELTAVGSISPVDYIVNSILNPNLAVKEQYVTRKVLTANGEVFTGIQIDRDDQRLRLRDASGKTIVVAASEIDQEGEGASLMPQGLTKFLTGDELLDLARFVSELGKPGPYAIRKVPSVQRWRVLRVPDEELTAQVPNVESLRVQVLAAKADAWTTAYGTAGGYFPLSELVRERPAVIYLQGEIQVNEPGPIAIVIDCSEPLHAWLDAEPFESQTRIERDLPAGKHTLTLRIAVTDREEPRIKVEAERPAGSRAQFVMVNGM